MQSGRKQWQVAGKVTSQATVYILYFAFGRDMWQETGKVDVQNM